MKGNKRVAIIGPGRMGLGIALAFALKGFRVRIIDLKERKAEAYEKIAKAGKREIESNVRFLGSITHEKRAPREILSRITFAHELSVENFRANFVFEAIPEKPDLKLKLFRKISPFIQRDSIVCSTTSTINLKTLRKGFIYPEKLLLTHWLNPAFIIPLVEVAATDETDLQSIEQMKEVLKKIGKVPVLLKDSPGFVVPRIQAVAMNEAIRIFQEGVATAEDIDLAIKTGFAFRLSVFGLLEFVDVGGLDILAYADDFLFSTLKSGRFEKPRLVEERMKKGETGLRGGKGFYHYECVDVRALLNKRYRNLIKLLSFMKKNGQM
jgi:3-hydroxybutyryl-CoA dehydrogenase